MVIPGEILLTCQHHPDHLATPTNLYHYIYGLIYFIGGSLFYIVCDIKNLVVQILAQAVTVPRLCGGLRRVIGRCCGRRIHVSKQLPVVVRELCKRFAKEVVWFCEGHPKELRIACE